MDLSLADKVAWITGGGGGIGSAVAVALAAEGARVALTGRRRSTLETVAERIAGACGSRAIAVPADVTDAGAVHAAAAQVEAELGSLDIVVNCAGAPGGRANDPLEAVDPAIFLADVDEKLLSCLRTAQAAVPFMKPRGWGRLIHIAGGNARTAGAYSAGARNIAMVHLSKTLSDELGPDGITSNVLHPGTTRGEWWEQRKRAMAEERGVDPEAVEAEYAARTSLGQLMDAEALAGVVAFLASPLSQPITGESIGIGGGFPGAVRL